MKILIYGIGAMGSIYAALLSKSGNEVYAVDLWEEHINQINKFGLKTDGASGKNIIKNISASTKMFQNINFDLCIISTKASGVENAASEISKIINKSTIILTIQNGLGSAEKLKMFIPEDQILLGVADGFGASIIKPGHVYHNAMKLIRIGELNSGFTKKLEKIVSVWTASGFNVKTFENINQLIWEKFICNVTYSAPCTVYNCTIGDLMANDSFWKVALGCTEEAYSIALKKDIMLSFNDPIKYVTEFGSKMPNAKPSMLLDHNLKRKSEIDFINGKVASIGYELNIKTPYNFMLSTIIKRKEEEFD